MKRKFVIGLLAIALIIALLATTACGRNGGEEDPPIVEVTPTPEPPAADPPAEDPPEDPPEELGPPRVITFGGPWAHGVMTGAEPDPEGIFYAIDQLRIPWLHDVIMPQFNVEFAHVYIPFGDEFVPSIAASVMAGEPLADFLLIQPFRALQAIQGGLLTPLDDFVPADNPIFRLENNAGLRPLWFHNDQLWMFTNNSHATLTMGLLVNMDMVERLALDCPIELFETGNWNWDNFRRLMSEATFSSTGDGVIDHVGIRTGDYHPREFFGTLVSANSGWLVDPTGPTNVLGLDSPQSMMALEFIYDIVVHDRVWSYLHGDIPPENALFAFGGWGGINDMEFAADWLPVPMGPMNTTGWTHSSVRGNGFTMQVGVEDPGFVFSVLDAHESGWPQGDPTLQHSLSYAQLEAALPTMASINRVLTNARMPAQNVDLARIIGHDFFDFFVDIMNGFIDRSLTPASAVESFRPQMQDVIDERLN